MVPGSVGGRAYSEEMEPMTIDERMEVWARAEAERNGAPGDKGYIASLKGSFAGAGKRMSFAADDIKAELRPPLLRVVDGLGRLLSRRR